MSPAGSVVSLGEPPAELAAALAGAGITVARRSALDDVPERCDVLLVHVSDLADVPEEGAEAIGHVPAGVELWLERAEQDGARVVFTVPRVTAPFIREVFLPRGLAAVLRAEPVDPAGLAQVVELCGQAVTRPSPPAPEDFPVGSAFDPTGAVARNAAAGYESARSLSLLGPSMGAFMAQLSDVTRRLLTALPPKIPWDPDDLSPSALVPAKSGQSPELRVRGIPNLGDVFEAHETPAARALLRNRPEDRAQSPQHPPAVLVLGESGTGKSLVAATFHEQLVRAVARVHGPGPVPLVQVNCGGMTAVNFDHNMFGAAPGHFTGVGATVGALARAAYGMVFLDEIGDLDLAAQQRLLTFLDHRRVTPTGIAPFPAYVHVVAATNRDLGTLIAQGRFRHDLLSRFAAHLTIPPLRDRDVDELRGLVDFVACNPSANPGRRVTHVTAEAMAKLLSMQYREGNFRELESIVHAGLRTAMRRNSPYLEAADVDSWEESFVPDSFERVVRIDRDMPPAPADVPVGSLREIHRLALLLGRPLLHTPNGDLVVQDRGAVYRRTAQG